MSKRFYPILGIGFWVLLWQLVATLLAKPLLLPTPLATLTRLFCLAGTPSFWQTVGGSLLRVLCGVLLALLLGTLLAWMTLHIKPLYHLISPLLSLFKSVPVVSVIFLLLLFVGRNFLPLFIAFMMTLPIVFANAREGLLQQDKDLLSMAETFRVPRTRMLKKLHLPMLSPYLLAAARSAISLGWKAGIAAEVLALTKNSIGLAIYEGRYYLETENLFAYTLAVLLISVAIERVALLLLGEKKSTEKEVRYAEN